MTLPGGLREASSRPLGGGDVAAVRRARLDDGREVVVKRTPYDAHLEAEGLHALRDAGATTPAVLAVSLRPALVAVPGVGGVAWFDPASVVHTVGMTTLGQDIAAVAPLTIPASPSLVGLSVLVQAAVWRGAVADLTNVANSVVRF